jgi:hypothetical protein
LPVLGVLGGDQGFEEVVEVSLGRLAEHETMVAGEPAGVIAGPQDQVVHSGNYINLIIVFYILAQ